jgi:hypothetical protein
VGRPRARRFWRRSNGQPAAPQGQDGRPAALDPVSAILAAFTALDPTDQALLDLSVGRGVPDHELAAVSRSDAESLSARRAVALERVTRGLELTPDEQLEHVRRVLRDVADGRSRRLVGGGTRRLANGRSRQRKF